MVEAVELSEDMADKTRKALAEAAPYVSTPVFVEVAQFFDRLSPPAPEVDEATKVWRESRYREEDTIADYEAAFSYRSGARDSARASQAAISYLREVLAAKDAERDHREKAWLGWQERCLKAESELAALRTEIERLKADNMPPEGYKNLYIAARDCIFDANKLGRIEDGWLLLENVNVSVAPKAAERNTAEPVSEIERMMTEVK